MPQYAMLIYADDSAHAPDATSEEKSAADRHAGELEDLGSMVAAWALTPRSMATSIRRESITDGPFVDAKEVVAGFYVVEAPHLDAAIALARQNPAVAAGGGIEIRPVHSGGSVER